MNIKKIFLILILLGISLSLAAEVRLDFAGNIPVYFGIQFEGENLGNFSNYTFLFPEIGLSYVIGDDNWRVGMGVRMFTLIIETLAWPNVFAEVDIDPFLLSVQVGGGAFGVFGIYNDTFTGPVVISDLSAAYKVNETFRAGVGCLMVGVTDTETVISQADVIPYSIYLFGKFSIGF